MQTLAVWGTVVAGLAGGFCIPAYAAPPEHADPAIAPWFKSLRQPQTNQPCCDVADCRTVEYRTAPHERVRRQLHAIHAICPLTPPAARPFRAP